MEITNMLQIPKGVTSIIGGGGKTTLMLKLASELKENSTVIVCTTTRIYPPEDIRIVTSDSSEEIRKEINEHGVICVSEGIDSSGKLMPPAIPFEILEEIAEYIICEADGSRGLPLKAHNEKEPVVPEVSNQTILVIGIDGVGRRVNEFCHRPEIYSRLAGVKQEDIVDAETVVKVIDKEKLGTKLFINKVESEELWMEAKKIRELVKLPVVAGSLRNGEYRCL